MNFPGVTIDDEVRLDAELQVSTEVLSPQMAANKVLEHLTGRDYFTLEEKK